MTPRSLPTLSTPPAPGGACGSCGYRHGCGGIDDESSLFGCFVDCGVLCTRDARGRCDYTCPKRPRQFARRWQEVGGFPVRTPRSPLCAPDGSLPLYVPMVRHGYRRDLLLPEKHVAIATFDLVGGAGAAYGPRASGAGDLRERLRLLDDAEVLFVSVSHDADLEQYWALSTELRVPARLASLDLWGMTSPNFSFFDNVPRTQILYNRARIVRSAEALSDAGVAPVLHLNAVTREDWRFWARLLREQPHVRYVAKEFQTGGRMQSHRAVEMIAGLRFVQERVQQELHPIIIGGTQYAGQIAEVFPNVTFVDSRPFMNAVHRRTFVMDVVGVRWEPSPTPSGAPIDQLLATNIGRYRRYVEVLAGRAGQLPPAALTSAAAESEDELLVDAFDTSSL